jgi:ParB/RepB/Spo0J family partition protein
MSTNCASTPGREPAGESDDVRGSTAATGPATGSSQLEFRSEIPASIDRSEFRSEIPRGADRPRPAGALVEVPPEQIEPDPTQPRRRFDPESLEQLARSLQLHGQLLPIQVRPGEAPGRWVIVSGERRHRAAIRAGLSTVRCLVVGGPTDPDSVLSQQLAENLHREALGPLELARALQRLMLDHGWTSSRVAGATGLSRSEVCKTLALLGLPEDVQALVADGSVPPSTAYELARLNGDPDALGDLARRTASEGLSRRAVAEAIDRAILPTASTPTPTRRGRPRGLTRTFRAEGARVTVALPPDRATDADALLALEAATRQLRARAAAPRPADAAEPGGGDPSRPPALHHPEPGPDRVLASMDPGI